MKYPVQSTTQSSKVQQPKSMFDTPFTNINDQGVLGVFGEQESRKIGETLRQINKNANVA